MKLRIYKTDEFIRDYLSNPFLSNKIKWDNMTLYGKFREVCSWAWRLFVTIVFIVVILLIVGAMFGAFNALTS